MEEEPKRIVIRSPQPVDPPPAPTEPGSDSDAPEPETPPELPPRPARGIKTDLPLAVAIFGGILAWLAPFLPWWTRSVGEIEGLSPIKGITTWTGKACDLAGAVLISVCAWTYLRSRTKLRFLALPAGTVALASSLVALLFGQSATGSRLDVVAQSGISIAILGGLAGTVGGYMLVRKDWR